MISTQAHNQNVARRKEFEGLGYKFSLGHDGWTLFFNADQIREGRCYDRDGEQRIRSCLDAAVLAAVKHRSDNVTIIKEPEPAPVIVEVLELTKLQRRMIESAVKLLETAETQYRIQAAGFTFTNIVEPVKKKKAIAPRQDHAAHYGPVLHPMVGQGPFCVDLDVPESLDYIRYRQSICNYLQGVYGTGCYTTSGTLESRKLTVLVEDAPFKEIE